MSRHPLDVKAIALIATAFFFPLWLKSFTHFELWMENNTLSIVYDALLILWGFGLNAWFLHLRKRKASLNQ